MGDDLFQSFIVLIFGLCWVSFGAGQNNDLQFAETPKIVTQDGHLVFMSAARHNITFRSSDSGFININGENLQTIVQLVKDNRDDLEDLKAGQGGGALLERLDALATRLDRVEPVMEALAQLNNTVTSQIEALSSRVTSLEQVTPAPSIANSIRRQLRQVTSQLGQLRRQYRNMYQRLRRNECASSPCQNGGTCVDAYNGFTCSCTDQWRGETCAEDVNECYMFFGTDLGCQNGATCTNTPGGFSCACTHNWHGVLCTESHDDCTGASSEALCGHGTCVNVPRTDGQAKYRCICDEGWTHSDSDPACTVDVDECDSSNGIYPCSVNPQVQCINLPGTFHCTDCPSGYTGNGRMCSDINECEINNGGCSQSPRVQCTNTMGSSICGHCPPGYQGDGKTCTFGGVCSVNNGGCFRYAICTNVPNSLDGRTCTCPPDYIGNGVGPNGCVPQSGQTSCVNNPCVHGQCLPGVHSYSCACHPGWVGRNCDQQVDACSSSPCQNGGSCSRSGTGYSCACTESFTGARCEEERESCGQLLVGESGELRYPSEDSSRYPNGVSCAWTISTAPNKVITLNFVEFKVEEHPDCSYDSLEVHDGGTVSAQLIGKYCGEKQHLPNNGVINSTHNQLYLLFQSDASNNLDGFRIHWTSALPVCGGVIEGQAHGTIQSPGYPGQYPHNSDCEWIIKGSPGNTIKLTFAHLDLESHVNCSYDFLRVYDGIRDDSPLIDSFCHSMTPAPIETSGPYAKLHFHSDASNSDTGFLITYSVESSSICGGQLTTDSGIVISPNYPNNYPHNVICTWTITVPENEVITLNTTNMDLESHDNCRFDYLEIRSGGDERGDFMGRFCGTTLPPVLHSPTNQLWMKFRTDRSSTGSGFRTMWEVECGGTFTAQTGELTSPYFPALYPNNKECTYLIDQPDGSAITLQFVTFDIEASRESCRHDYLEVRNGGGPNSPLQGRYCGSSIPATLVTTTNQLWLKFHSDGSIQRHGFRATYSVDYNGGGNGGGGGSNATTGMNTCGGSLTSASGQFSSPQHPDNYAHGMNCTWYITVAPSSVIRLVFTTFSLESHEACGFDAVIVYDTDDVGQIGRFCGSNIPPVITSSSNTLRVVFTSDSSVSQEGFVASYDSLDASQFCGGMRGTNTGVIRSPNYPQNYPHNRDCEWFITVANNRQILLNITDMRMENQSSCVHDYLEIRNGGFATSPLAGRYCGWTNESRQIVSHSNRVYLKFHSDDSNSDRGFEIFYDGTSTGCGGEFSTPTGVIISPNYPLSYGHRAECFWTITVSQGNRVRVSIEDLDLEGHTNCNFDYLKLRDRSSSGPVLGKYCGTTIPDPVTSRSNVVFVKFRSDYSGNGRGFKISYQTTCNGRLRQPSGVIESINFPGAYPHEQNCTYIVESTLGNTVNARFTHFHTEASDTCQHDYVQIRDGETASSPSIGRYCGSSLPGDLIQTNSRYLYVHFASDANIAHSGFRLEYVVQGCGSHFRGSNGSFQSPNYPNPYPHDRECIWTIEVDPGMKVELSIHSIDVEYHENCSRDILQVYGGLDSTSVLLTSLCHSQNDTQTLTSTGNYLTVRFRSDSANNGLGFNASFRAVEGGCGGNFSTKSAHLTSPDYPNAYPHNTDCIWYIHVKDNHSVKLHINDLVMEHSTACTYDYIAIYDGQSVGSPQLQKICTHVSEDIYSSGSYMTVRMRSDSSVNDRGFNATYMTTCGSRRNTAVDGAITTPNFPDSYEPNVHCTWYLFSDHPGDRITLTFTHMNVPGSWNCTNDYVRVLDGNDVQAPVVETLCGDAIPTPIVSQGSGLVVQFMSDGTTQGRGFRATYTKSLAGCGGTYTEESGAFNTPMYPNPYPSNMECVWIIQGPPGATTQLVFRTFELDGSAGYCNRSNDYVEVREGNSTGRLLAEFCGQQLTGTNMTRAAQLWVRFVSNGDDSRMGFTAEYSTEYGGELTGTAGEITSPGYPSNYPNHAHYNWLVTVPIGNRVSIEVTSFSLEHGGSSCPYDYLMVRDGGTSTDPVLGKYCGYRSNIELVSTGNQAYLTFHTDGSSTASGFHLRWSATTDGSSPPSSACGGRLVATLNESRLTSPNYPQNYANSLDCVWYIRSAPSFQVWFNITDMNTESHERCSYDVLTLYSGEGVNTQNQLDQFCGRRRNEQPVLSGMEGMTARFKTDGSATFSGFEATYKAVCGGVINGESGVIASPWLLSSQAVPPSQNCTWRVRVTPGRTVQLNFTSFALSGSQGQCAGDYFVFYNGEDTSSPVLGEAQYCGSSIPKIPVSNYHRVTVQLMSDSQAPVPEFSLTWSEQLLECGGNIHLSSAVSSGFIESPNYPDVYPVNAECLWVITAEGNAQVQLDFPVPIQMERGGHNCSYDYVEVRDGGTGEAALLGRYCDQVQPDTIKSSANSLYIKMRSDNGVSGAGFRIAYKIATCGGSYSGSEGSIQTPNYPQNYANDLDCEWFIRAPTGHYLTFTFISFNTESSGNCTQGDYVQIREYNQTGNELGLFCGTAAQSVDTSDSFAYVKFHSNAAIQYPGVKIQFQASIEECGGRLTTSTGTLLSPNYPGQYPHRRNCVWHITVASDRRVTLHIRDLNVEHHDRCQYDYVAVYNGVLRNSPLIGRYCGQSSPRIIESTGNTMTVQFRTDGSVSDGGFNATYSSDAARVCGGTRTVTSTLGTLQSPGYDAAGYNASMECIWALEPSPSVTGTTLAMRFTALSVERHGECRYDHVEVKEDASSSLGTTLMGRYCGNVTLPRLSSPGSVTVKFFSDIVINDQGFKLEYSLKSCGGVLSDSSGSITSPGYPSQYEHNDDCAWLIEAPVGSQIKIEFESIYVEDHPECVFDYVEIFNGASATSPSVGRFCGSQGRDMLSQSNYLRVEWHTDGSGTHPGFKINYQIISQGCGGLIHGQDGSVFSPGWPQNYSANSECLWEVNVLPGYHIEAVFDSVFALQQDCGDYVQVDDFYEESWHTIGRYCNNTVPQPIRTRQNKMRIKFHSDGSQSFSGFSLNYTSGCGATFTAESGTIISPGFPTGYANNMHCNYTITTDEDQFIVLQFDPNNFFVEGQRNKDIISTPVYSADNSNDSATEAKSDRESWQVSSAHIVCMFDHVSVYSINPARELGRFCGMTAPQQVSSRQAMRLEFVTDSTVTDKGWVANYWTRQCGGNFTDSSGTISTPTHPNVYHHNANCTWFITVGEDRVVRLKFTDFALEGAGACEFDRVSVYDGVTVASRLIGHFCGSTAPPLIQSTGNQLMLQFITDSSVAYKGFHASYWESYGPDQGCGGMLNTSTGTIRPVDIDNDGVYERNQDCVWHITVLSHQVIQISTTGAFDVERSNCLRYDYLEIRDGFLETDPLVGQYCGNRGPDEFTSSTNSLYVKFISDSSTQRSGFTLTYTATNRSCGGIFMATESPQNMTSLGYPDRYSNQVNCRWLIDAPGVPYPRQVLINVLDVDIEEHARCEYDYLELRDQPLGWSGQSLHYCGVQQTGIPFTSVGRTVQVNMRTDGSTTGRGFLLQYQILSCNRTFSAKQGRITSPGFPGRYRQSHNCLMTISVEEGRTLALYFSNLAIENHAECNYDYLQIFNGSDTEQAAPKLCGDSLPNPFFLNNHVATLRFVTDSSVHRDGFDITYTSTTAGLGCGGDFTSQNGTFTSPDYPGLSTQAYDCTWNIKAAARHTITVEWQYLDFSNANSTCERTHVALYEGVAARAPLLLRFCGNEGPKPANFISSSKTISVVFKAEAGTTGQGFRLNYVGQ